MIVDLACSTGNTAVPWAGARGRTVVGVDVSEAMLRVAGLRLEKIGVIRRLKGRPIRKLDVPVKRGA